MTQTISKQQWFDNMVASVRRKLDMAMIDLGMSYDDARDYVEIRSTAGKDVWALIDREFKA